MTEANMSDDTTQHTPADVRERVEEAWATVEAAALAQANVLDSHYGGQPAKAAEIRNAVEQVAALLRTPRGGRSALWWAANELVAALEGRSTLTVQQCITGVKRLLAEADLRTPRGEGEDTIPVSALRSEIAQLKAHGLLPYLAWARLCALAGGGPVGEDTPAALRSDAQEKEDALVCASCGKPIGDEPTVIWQDAYTHYRCTPEDAIRDDTPVIRPIDAARRGEGGGT